MVPLLIWFGAALVAMSVFDVLTSGRTEKEMESDREAKEAWRSRCNMRHAASNTHWGYRAAQALKRSFAGK